MDILDNRFRALLADKAVPLGSWLMAGTPVTAEAMGCAGFDWLVLDMEHVPIDYQDAYQILQAVGGTPACPVVRLAWNDLCRSSARSTSARRPDVPIRGKRRRSAQRRGATRYPQPGQAIAGRAALRHAPRQPLWHRADYATVQWRRLLDIQLESRPPWRSWKRSPPSMASTLLWDPATCRQPWPYRQYRPPGSAGGDCRRCPPRPRHWQTHRHCRPLAGNGAHFH